MDPRLPGPTLSELSGASVVRVVEQIEAQMAVKSDAEVALIRESVRWGNLAHRLLQRYTRVGVTETEVSQRASDEATFAMLDAIGRGLPRRRASFFERRERRLSRPDRAELGDPARAGRKPRLRSEATSSSPVRERARLGLPLRARADDVRRRAHAPTRSGCSRTWWRSRTSRSTRSGRAGCCSDVD